MQLGKGVAVHTVVIVIVMAMLAFFSLVLLWHYMAGQQIEANKATCSIKLTNYCIEWYKRGFEEKPDPGWDEIPPENCEDFDITEPTVEECQNILQVSG